MGHGDLATVGGHVELAIMGQSIFRGALYIVQTYGMDCKITDDNDRPEWWSETRWRKWTSLNMFLVSLQGTIVIN